MSFLFSLPLLFVLRATERLSLSGTIGSSDLAGSLTFATLVLVCFVRPAVMVSDFMGQGNGVIAYTPIIYAMAIAVFAGIACTKRPMTAPVGSRRKSLAFAGMLVVFAWVLSHLFITIRGREDGLPEVPQLFFGYESVVPSDVAVTYRLSQHLRLVILPNLQIALLFLGFGLLFARRLHLRKDKEEQLLLMNPVVSKAKPRLPLPDFSTLQNTREQTDLQTPNRSTSGMDPTTVQDGVGRVTE